MVIFNDLVEERSECGVRIMRSSINTNSRVNVLGARKDSFFETEASFVLAVL